jgi:L-alanine-DL-glutamate epimerase-like enolase superfamily enzyme
MQITRVRAYRQLQPLRDGTYAMVGGESNSYDSLIVAVDTDEDVSGWGEMGMLGSFYHGFAAGARAATHELGTALIGEDPTQHRRIVRRLDTVMRGQAYAKSALDMACWDISGRAHRRPLCEELGGRFGDSVALYNAVSLDTSAAMSERAVAFVSEGYRRLQVKVGTDVDADVEHLEAVRDAVGDSIVLFADANGGFTTADALRFLRATRPIDYTLEQPCASLEECERVRRHCDRPMVLDESIVSLPALLEATRRGVPDGITIKISRVGGVTRAATIRDVAVELGLQVTVEDGGGASIDTAAMTHLSLSTPDESRIHTVNYTAWVTIDNANGIPEPENGRLRAPAAPGLGVEVLVDRLGEPFADIT